MKQNFVTFYSPGTFIDEDTTVPIDSWDVDQAIQMARGIKERHKATPFGFQFITRGRTEDELDSRVIDKSPMYYLGGTIETREEVLARNDPSEHILRSNMEGNGIDRIITNTNSWKVTKPFGATDIRLDFEVERLESVEAK